MFVALLESKSGYLLGILPELSRDRRRVRISEGEEARLYSTYNSRFIDRADIVSDGSS